MTSIARRPRAFLKIAGKQTPLLTFHVLNNSHFQCDTFDFDIAAFNQPDGFGLEYWGAESLKGVQIEILSGFLEPGQGNHDIPPNLKSEIMGEVDDVDASLARGIRHVSGRDLTRRLIDNKIAKTWPDHTASQIVTDLAGQVGLTPDVMATKTPVGKYASGAYSRISRDVPMWDLITGLAREEGYDAYVSGSTLHFGPAQSDTEASFDVMVSRNGKPLTLSVLEVHLKRSLTLAKDITVTVLSYAPSKKQPIKAVARRQGAAKSASTSFRTGSTSQNYTIRKPGLTPQQATELAQKTLQDLSRHERGLEYDLSYDAELTSRRKTRLFGTQTDWDTSYFIDTVTRTYSFGSFTMNATAKNHEIESDPVT